jgi:hypothetical protein
MLSQFHFSRTFLAATGVSPGRFLSAIRLHRAKTLLLTTSETVTDISYMVGYNSLGTFTTRFTRSVGIPPTRFRSTAGFIGSVPGTDKAYAPSFAGSIDGRVSVPRDARLTRIYLGIFDGAIAQGPVVACAVLDGSLTFKLSSVPEGEWYALAVGADTRDQDARSGTRFARMVARVGPVKVIDGEKIDLKLTMRSVQPTDPPILLALPSFEVSGRPQIVSTLR